MSLVVGTAGHIDHGKTTLLRALTGIDADRLPEERRRGMTIDVGYAHLDLEAGGAIDFVDVPGHDALVGNMLVGAGEIDAAMLVVAADDGPRAQTLEHLELLDALGIDRGLAVVTKADLAGPDRAAAVAAEVAALLDRTTLAGVPVFVASSTTGEGLEPVRAALLALAVADQVRPEPVSATAGVLAIDRVFTVKGRGTVVTGTLRGSVGRNDTGGVIPGPVSLRVREVQVRGRMVDRSVGGRTALNVGGVESADLRRGQAVVVGRPTPEVVATDRLLAVLRAPVAWPTARPATAPRIGETLRLHLGTAQADARIRAFGPDAAVRLLVLDRPVAAAAGDRFVLRRPTPEGAAAAGRVLDPVPPRGPSRRRATSARIEALGGSPGDPAARLDLHGALVEGRTVRLAHDVRDRLEAVAVEAVADHHAATPDSAGIGAGDLRAALARSARRIVALDAEAAPLAAEAVVDALVTLGRLARDGDRLRDPSRAAGPPPELAAAMDRLEAALAIATPPSLEAAARAVGCPPEGIRLLTAAGRLIRLEADLAWAMPTYQRLAAVALSLARRGPLTPAAFRDASGSSRRYALAILEDLDRRGILARTPDGHVPGPRAQRT